jgi:hypothetical protein
MRFRLRSSWQKSCSGLTCIPTLYAAGSVLLVEFGVIAEICRPLSPMLARAAMPSFGHHGCLFVGLHIVGVAQRGRCRRGCQQMQRSNLFHRVWTTHLPVGTCLGILLCWVNPASNRHFVLCRRWRWRSFRCRPSVHLKSCCMALERFQAWCPISNSSDIPEEDPAHSLDCDNVVIVYLVVLEVFECSGGIKDSICRCVVATCHSARIDQPLFLPSRDCLRSTVKHRSSFCQEEVDEHCTNVFDM